MVNQSALEQICQPDRSPLPSTIATLGKIIKCSGFLLNWERGAGLANLKNTMKLGYHRPQHFVSLLGNCILYDRTLTHGKDFFFLHSLQF